MLLQTGERTMKDCDCSLVVEEMEVGYFMYMLIKGTHIVVLLMQLQDQVVKMLMTLAD